MFRIDICGDESSLLGRYVLKDNEELCLGNVSS